MSGSRQPVFSFTGGRYARVDICYDRACDHVWSLVPRRRSGAARDAAAGRDVLLARGRAPPDDAAWQLVIPSRESGLTTTFATVPDYNGDGLADVAIGVPSAGTGSVPVFFGSFFGVNSVADVTLTGGDQFGRAIAAVGDLNGDGFVDLAVASGGDPGAVNIYEGGAAGPTMGNTLLPPGPVTAGFGDDDGQRGRRQRRRLRRRDRRRAARSRRCSWAARRGWRPRPRSRWRARRAATRCRAGRGRRQRRRRAGCLRGRRRLPRHRKRLRGADELHARNLAADFVGDNDGDGLTDFAADQAIFPGTPGGHRRDHTCSSRRARPCSRAAGDIDGDGYADTVSSLSAVEGFPERERVYFGSPTGCGTNGCRAFSPLFIPGHDFTPAAERDYRRGGRHQRRRRRRPGRADTRERGRLHLSGGRRARAAAGVVPPGERDRGRRQPGGAVRHGAGQPV